jgi:hypothetical protein
VSEQRIELAEDAGGVGEELTIREARDAPAGAQQRAVARSIAVEGAAGAAVEGPGVDLDDEAVVRPTEVVLARAVVAVDLRARQAGVEAELEELGLEGAPRRRLSMLTEVGEEGGQWPTPRTSWVGVEDGGDRGQVEEVRLHGPLDGSSKVMGRHDGGQIEERARHGGHRHTSLDRSFGGRQVPPAVDDPARPSPCPTRPVDRQLDERATRRPKTPKAGSAAVAQHGVVACRQDDREKSALTPQLGMPEGIHAPFEPAKAAGRQAMVDRVLAEPQRHELPSRHDSVLHRAQPVDLDLDGTQPAHIAG